MSNENFKQFKDVGEHSQRTKLEDRQSFPWEALAIMFALCAAGGMGVAAWFKLL